MRRLPLLLAALAASMLLARSVAAGTPHARVAFIPDTSFERPPAVCVIDVASLATACPLPPETDVDDFFLTWSPRGTMIAVQQLVYQGGQDGVPLAPVSRRIAVVAADGTDHLPNGQPSPEFLASSPFLASNPALGKPMWSNDSRRVAGLSQSGIVIADVGGGRVQTLDLGAKSMYNAAWSPDNRHFAVGRDDPGGNGTAVVLVDAETGTQQTLLHFDANAITPGSIFGISWSPDGEHIVLTYALPPATVLGTAWPSQLWIVDADGKNAKMLYNSGIEDESVLQATFSNDGKLIAFGRYSGKVENIFLMNSDGSDLRQLTHSVTGAYGPRFDGDGRVLYYDFDTDTMSLITFTADNPEHGTVKTLVHAIEWEWAPAPGPLPRGAVTPTPTVPRPTWPPTPQRAATSTPSGRSTFEELPLATPAQVHAPPAGTGTPAEGDRSLYKWFGLLGAGMLVSGLAAWRATLRNR